VVQQRLVHRHIAVPRHFDPVGSALWIEKLVVNRYAPIPTADAKRSSTKFSAGPRASCPQLPHGNRAWGISHLANIVAIEKPCNSLVACSTAMPSSRDMRLSMESAVAPPRNHGPKMFITFATNKQYQTLRSLSTSWWFELEACSVCSYKTTSKGHTSAAPLIRTGTVIVACPP
jgi:hypothetical protein